ncbi:hypothetical protein Zmor_012495 [Zophobas morio]|uniref:Gustatory receptor n=1 Tax=Zophobas morio TaxID=2755281 RepID=A0AA38I8X8_9CUCU|nr:hypothetical protein Zmor_012495 [Zophobas morio]
MAKLNNTNPYKWFTLTAQCFALLPVDGIKSNNIHFQWKSVHICYTLFITLVLCVLLIFEVIYSSGQILSEYRINSLITKICSVLMLIVHLRLGYKWPSLMQNWSQTETVMDIRYGRLENFGLRVKICILLFFVTTTAGHLNAIVYQYMYGHVLKFDFYAFIFDYIPFNSILGITLAFVYTVHFFILNFNDFFIIVTSMYVALRFQQIRKRLERQEKHAQRGVEIVDFWQEMRRDYDRLSNLCLEVDDGINGLIFVSFADNLYCVISYLFRQLMVENEGAQLVIFYVFFPIMVVKVLTVCLYTSWINDESLAPVNILNSVSSRDYNPEIGRWLTQMSFDKVALTGGKIFKITRSIFLSVASLVVTYELVVMQFHGFSSKA